MDRFRHIQFLDVAPVALPIGHLQPSCLVASSGPGRQPAQAVDPDAAAFLAWVLDRGGLELDDYRIVALARRLRACLRSLHVQSLAEARARVTNRPELLTVALSALLIGVSEFFRDTHVFASLDREILPTLAARGRTLRAWSAGCADGAELYSVAMLLAEHHLLEESYLLGTDCRADAIQRARRGWFDQRWHLTGLPANMRQTYFVRSDNGWQVRARIHQATRWTCGNILQQSAPESPSWDIVLCRNVAIYLEPPATAALWTRLTGSLRKGGILVVGKAERPPAQLPLRQLTPCIFQRS